MIRNKQIKWERLECFIVKNWTTALTFYWWFRRITAVWIHNEREAFCNRNRKWKKKRNAQWKQETVMQNNFISIVMFEIVTNEQSIDRFSSEELYSRNFRDLFAALYLVFSILWRAFPGPYSMRGGFIRPSCQGHSLLLKIVNLEKWAWMNARRNTFTIHDYR